MRLGRRRGPSQGPATNATTTTAVNGMVAQPSALALMYGAFNEAEDLRLEAHLANHRADIARTRALLLAGLRDEEAGTALGAALRMSYLARINALPAAVAKAIASVTGGEL